MLMLIWAALVFVEHKAGLKLPFSASLGACFEDHATYFDILPRASDCFVKTLCVLLTPRPPGQGRCSLQISPASVSGAVTRNIGKLQGHRSGFTSSTRCSWVQSNEGLWEKRSELYFEGASKLFWIWMDLKTEACVLRRRFPAWRTSCSPDLARPVCKWASMTWPHAEWCHYYHQRPV